MKFILTKGAPDITLELIQAQETENLVFFCGAGISYPAGLPGFEDLVEKVYESLGESKSGLEEEAFNARFYDRALGLLEKRIVGDNDRGVNLVRRAIIQTLTIPDGANLQNHQAILQLSKTTNQKHRLVTTNVDHGFLKAKSAISSVIDAAPKLPVPKPHKWESVVHLHGIIDDNDPDGERLIFTSGDFGSAYLTERWASRFITELFSHFTVLFVGYSVNDPVIRYMTDAIAAERLKGDKVFKQPYVIAHTKPSQRIDSENAWKAKGIEPVLYNYSHNNLTNTLKAWGDYVRDGLNAKVRIVHGEASVAPLPPYDQDPSVTRLMDVLSEKTRPNHEDVTGYPARVFREMNNPSAPIEWLPVLHEKGLLSIAKQNELVHPVHWSPWESNLVRPNPISFELWHWLLHHLEDDTLLVWVIDQGVCLHPDLKDIIARHIDTDPPQEPYLRFWKIVTSDYVYCGRELDTDGYEQVKALEKSVDPLTLLQLSKLMEPFFKLNKSITLPDLWDEKGSVNVKRAPYDVEVVIGLSDWVYNELTKLDVYPSKFVDLLLPATQALIRALDFWDFADPDDERNDRSHWDMPSISPHLQNGRYRTWVILIELCRDLWEATWDKDKEKAQSVLNIWRSMKYPVFRRLTLHAMTVKEIAQSDTVMEYLLEDNSWWLWSVGTQREVFRLLAVLWPKLDEPSSIHLVNTILQGPPRAMFRADLNADEWQERFDHDVWLMLSKLQSFGRDLPDKALAMLKQLSAKYPWVLQDGERDEFTHWMEVGTGYRVDTTLEKLFDKEVPELVAYLLEDSPYKEGRIDLFRTGSGNKDFREKAITVLRYLDDSKNWDGDIWHAGLTGLANSDTSSWKEIAPLLVNAPPEFYGEESWPVAHWAKKNISSIECETPEENYFWAIFKLLLDNCSSYKEPNQIREAVSYAINNPVGIISEALIDRFGVRKLEAGSGISDGPLRDSLRYLLSSKNQAAFAGKILLASRLHYFYAIDPEWTEKSLVPLFDWEDSEFAPLIWQGYLWSPRISTDLALVLKNHLISAVKHAREMGESAERLIQLFAVVCLQYPDLFKVQEQRDALVDVGTDGLEHIAKLFWQSIAKDQESADNYWRNRIFPFMEKVWPKAAEFVSDKTSRYFALVAIGLEDAFEEALEFLWPFIKPLSDLSFFLNHLVQKDLPDKKPKDVLRLLSKVFSEQYPIWFSDTLHKILDRLVKAEPNIADDPAYMMMNDYLMQCEH